MTEWHKEKVSELEQDGVLLVQDGNHGNDRPRPNEFSEEGTAFIRAADIIDGVVRFDKAERINNTARLRIRKGRGRDGDVLLSHKGTVGKVAHVPAGSPPFVCSPQTTFWRTLKPHIIDAGFLRHFMVSASFVEQLESIKGESDMAPYVSLSAQRRLLVSIPPIEEQRAIAEVLGALDDKIAANEESVALGQQLITTAYRLAVEHSDPENLMAAVEVTFGEAFKGAHFSQPGDGRPLIRIRDLKSRKPAVWTTEKRDRETVVSAGELLIGMDGEFRVTTWTGEAGLLNQRVCRPRGRTFGAAYLREALRAPLARLENEKVATTVIHLNKSDLERESIRVAKPQALSIFEQISEPIYDGEVALARQNCALAEFRDALLPALMSGKLRVKDAERAVEDVL